MTMDNMEQQAREHHRRYREVDPINHDLSFEDWLAFFDSVEQAAIMDHGTYELGLELTEDDK